MMRENLSIPQGLRQFGSQVAAEGPMRIFKGTHHLPPPRPFTRRSIPTPWPRTHAHRGAHSHFSQESLVVLGHPLTIDPLRRLSAPLRNDGTCAAAGLPPSLLEAFFHRSIKFGTMDTIVGALPRDLGPVAKGLTATVGIAAVEMVFLSPVDVVKVQQQMNVASWRWWRWRWRRRRWWRWWR